MNEQLTITHFVRINNTKAEKDNTPLLSSTARQQPDEWYRALAHPYPKFFKMDVLSKWAWLGTEILLSGQAGFVYEGLDKNNIGLVLTTTQGCLEVDKKYLQTVSEIPSPALFVYTLPNIMLGEICIRHGFKGEQLSQVTERFDGDAIWFWVNDLMRHKGMDACVCGYVDATDAGVDLCLFWVEKNKQGVAFTAAHLEKCYKQ